MTTENTECLPDRARTWNGVWRDLAVEEWDLTSYLVFRELREKFALAGASVLELGSGSGRISLRLAEAGARVTLLDGSAESFVIATRAFAGRGANRPFVRASCLALPVRAQRYDLIWASGLFPHLTAAEQRQALQEAKLALRPDGVMVLFNANAGCLVHTVGMKLLQAIGRYPYGYEVPVTTMRDCGAAAGLEMREEYSCNLIGLPIVFFKRLALLPLLGVVGQPLYRQLTRLVLAVLQGPLGAGVIACDRWLARCCGGYFLVSVMAPVPVRNGPGQ